MKKETKQRGLKNPILFHLRPYKTFSQEASYMLLAFSTRDRKVADIVRDMMKNNKNILSDNKDLVTQIARIGIENPVNLRLEYLANDLNAMEDALSKQLARDHGQNLCYHVIISAKTIADLTLAGTRDANPLAVSAEIRETIFNCSTCLFSYYVDTYGVDSASAKDIGPSTSGRIELADPAAQAIQQKTKQPPEIIDDAEKLLKRVKEDPLSVDTQDVGKCQALLDKILQESAESNHGLRSQCNFTLLKVHYTLAVRATEFESTKYHLFKAALCLRASNLGSDIRSIERTNAVLYHMFGKVLMEKNKEPELALCYLQQAHDLYKAHQMTGPMNAVLLLSPDVISDRSENSHSGMK